MTIQCLKRGREVKGRVNKEKILNEMKFIKSLVWGLERWLSS